MVETNSPRSTDKHVNASSKRRSRVKSLSMLKAIFYARFHSERGAVKLIQHPPDVDLIFTDANDGDEAPPVGFQQLSSHIIPPYELCNQAHSTSVGSQSLLGWPVSIEDEKYPRNRFTFNVCFVLDEKATSSQGQEWDAIVRKTARWFREVEEEAGELSCFSEKGLLDGHKDAVKDASRLQKVIEQIFDQLNDYGECCARLSDIHVLNLRLGRTRLSSQKAVHAWDVPVLVAELVPDDVRTWDLVLKRIHPHINGVSHVRKIANLADVELHLAIDCVASLLEAGAVIMLDIFHFQAIYTPTQDIAWFMQDEEMQRECMNYISATSSDTNAGLTPLSRHTIVSLYLELKRKSSIADIYLLREDIFRRIDIRRFITFGVIKGFLRRVHKYARLEDTTATKQPLETASGPGSYNDAVKKFEDAWKRAALSSGWATPPSDLPSSVKLQSSRNAEDVKREQDNKLKTMLDGRCCFDQICVEMAISEKQLLEKLKSGAFGDVVIFTR